MKNMERLFLDMDGTLAEFIPTENMEILYQKGYFESLAPYYTMVENIKTLISEQGAGNIFVLSAFLFDSDYALAEKESWIDKYLPEIPKENLLFVPYGDSKHEYIPGEITKQDVLIDDFTANLLEFEKNGGSAIKLLNGINDRTKAYKGVRLAKDENYQNFKKIISKSIRNKKERRASYMKGAR